LIETANSFVAGTYIQSDRRDAAVGEFLHCRGKNCPSHSLATVRRMAKNVLAQSTQISLRKFFASAKKGPSFLAPLIPL
jgi:hypothetical protein